MYTGEVVATETTLDATVAVKGECGDPPWPLHPPRLRRAAGVAAGGKGGFEVIAAGVFDAAVEPGVEVVTVVEVDAEMLNG
jgi:hypothetical protein